MAKYIRAGHTIEMHKRHIPYTEDGLTIAGSFPGLPRWYVDGGEVTEEEAIAAAEQFYPELGFRMRAERDQRKLRDALRHAIRVIENYQYDIRNSKEHVGINLAKRGFCQGTIYQNAIDDIKKLAGID